MKKKLNAAQIQAISENSLMSQRELAKHYGVSATLINQIKNPFPTQIIPLYIRDQIARSIRSVLSLSRQYRLPKHVVTQIKANKIQPEGLSLDEIKALRELTDLSHLNFPPAAVDYLHPPPPSDVPAPKRKRSKRIIRLSEEDKAKILADPREAHVIADELGLPTPWIIHDIKESSK